MATCFPRIFWYTVRSKWRAAMGKVACRSVARFTRMRQPQFNISARHSQTESVFILAYKLSPPGVPWGQIAPRRTGSYAGPRACGCPEAARANVHTGNKPHPTRTQSSRAGPNHRRTPRIAGSTRLRPRPSFCQALAAASRKVSKRLQGAKAQPRARTCLPGVHCKHAPTIWAARSRGAGGAKAFAA